MQANILLILSSVLIFQNTIAQKIYNIKDFNAVADGKTSNTIPIQNAIDSAAKKGGGIILIPSGDFVTGVIELKSGVGLQLEAGAKLLGSARRLDYGPSTASALIVADSQHDISITGEGTIDGQANELLKDIYRMLNAGTLQDKEWKTENPWHQIRPEERNRPKIIEFKNCRNIKIKGVTIRDGLCWVENYKNCSNLIVDSIRVESNTFLNNDGIDLVDCKNAVVTNSSFNVADDGICLKSEDRNRICENIYINNCKIRSSASAFKLGTASRGGFKNISVNNLEIYDTYRSAIALEAVDGGILENVDVKNVIAKNTGNAIFIRLGHRNRDSVYSKINHIHISNVKVSVPAGKPDKGYSMEGPIVREPHNVYPSSIVGLPAHPVENVVLDQIDINYEGGANKDSAYFNPDSLSQIPELGSAYPEFSMFGELPCWGLYVRHTTGLQMTKVKLDYQREDFRTAMVFDEVTNLKIDTLEITPGNRPPLIIMNDTKQIDLYNLKTAIPEKTAVKYQGTRHD